MKPPFVVISQVEQVSAGVFKLRVLIDGQEISEERTQRTYATATDALTSARHVVKNATGERPAAMK